MSSAPLGTPGDSIMTLTFIALLGLVLCRGPWDQVQAVPPKPSIWADPGPIISKGSPVTIWCQGSPQADVYILYKDRGYQTWNTKTLQASSNESAFPIETMSPNSVGRYYCSYSSSRHWSEKSDPLSLVMTGEHRAPFLSAYPGLVVASGGKMSLLCSSQSSLDTFHLLKEGGAEPPRHRKSEWRSYDSRWQAVFPVGPVDSSHGGTYRCYGSSSSNPNVWSQPSDPLHLQITGMSWKPSLSAHPGPSVPCGANVTLQCGSKVKADTFHLHREGSLDPPQQLRLQDTAAPSQANFTIIPVTWEHNGTYRCYSSHSSSPFQLSQPSDPLELLVSAQGLQWSWNMLTGVSVTLILLLSLLFFLLQHLHQSKGRMSGATDLEPKDRGLQTRSNPPVDAQEEPLYAVVKDPQPREREELDPQQSRTHDDPQGVTCTQVTRSRSKLRQRMAICPSSLSWGLLVMKGRQAEEDTQVDSEAAASENPQDVTYAQLTHLAVRQETSVPPSSPSEEPPDEPTVYAALAIH